MAILPMTIGGGGGGELQETTLANYTIPAYGSSTKSIGITGAKIVAIYGNLKFSNSYAFMASPVSNYLQIASSTSWSDSTTTTISFSGDSYTIDSTSTYTATLSNIKVIYEV